MLDLQKLDSEGVFTGDVVGYDELSVEIREELVKGPVLQVYFGHQVQYGPRLQKAHEQRQHPARQKRVEQADIRAGHLVN